MDEEVIGGRETYISTKASFSFGRKNTWLPLAGANGRESIGATVLPGFDALHILLPTTFAGEPQRL